MSGGHPSLRRPLQVLVPVWAHLRRPLGRDHRLVRIAADERLESVPDHCRRPRGHRARRRLPHLARDADRLCGRRGYERGVSRPLLRRPRGRPHRLRRRGDLPPDDHLGFGPRPRLGVFDPERPAGLAQGDGDGTREDRPYRRRSPSSPSASSSARRSPGSSRPAWNRDCSPIREPAPTSRSSRGRPRTIRPVRSSPPRTSR